MEPPPTAEVILHTTTGDIHLELFGKQTPLATRNFLQLCLDGYYDNTIFHRLVPGFVIQGGDPTGTGEGGEASYDGGTFADEFHSRLRFNRRGLLGMANTGQKDDNGSQFFITLGKTEELNGKNTMFGRVVGDSIYVVTKMAEAELLDVEGSERPMYPTSITSTEILVNPYKDMVARKVAPKVIPTESVPTKKKAKKKAAKALLSFGEDGEEPEEPVLKKPKFNPKLVSAGVEIQQKDTEQKKTKAKKNSEAPARRVSRSPSPQHVPRQNTRPETQLPLRNDEVPSRDPSPSTSLEPEPVQRVTTALERTNAQIAELKASMKRNVQVNVPTSKQKKSALEQMIPENALRGRKRKQNGKEGNNETEALNMLNAFRAKLEKADFDAETSKQDVTETKINSKQHEVGDDEEAQLCDLHFIANCQSCQSWDDHANADDDDLNDKGWMSHSLNFEKDRLSKDLNWKKKNEEELVVIDPREKAKDIKEEQRAKKLARNGGSRAWDRDRDRDRLSGKIAGSNK
jgi:peptidyl-prolyl cis-trans isomerase SDCCAG10